MAAPYAERTKLVWQAEILEHVARWSLQPDEPTGVQGVLSARDLLLHAAALRTRADVPLPRR